MLEPRSLIRVWGPPSAVVDEVTGDVSINIGGVIIETFNRAYDARQKLADEQNPAAPSPPEQVVVVSALLPPPPSLTDALDPLPPIEPLAPEPVLDDSATSKTSTLSKLLGKRDSKAPKS